MSYMFPKITPEQLTELRRELARLLGDGWSHTPNPNHVFLNTQIKGPNGAVITVTTDKDNKGKVVIGGWSENYSNVPYYTREKHPMPSIAVSYARGVETIFKEIGRRFMSGFLEALIEADQRVAQDNAARNQSKQTFGAVYIALGSKAYRQTLNEDGGGTIAGGESGNGWIDIRVNGADSVEFSVKYLNRERAVKLAQFLSTL